jgi:hypothetical protein
MLLANGLILSDKIKMIDNRDGGFDFEVQGRGKKYTIRYSITLFRWLCDCRDFTFRRLDVDGAKCKHIKELESEFPVQMDLARACVPICNCCALSKML